MKYAHVCPCGNETIVERPMAAPGGPIEKWCNQCERTTVQTQVVHATTVQFKGTGFYVTDEQESRTRVSTPHTQTRPDHFDHGL